MKTIEDSFISQDRWNDTYGKAQVIDRNPARFLVDPSKLSPPKRDLVKFLGDVRGKTILEFGSGRGTFAVALAKLGGSVIGVDIGPDLVDLARKVATLNQVTCEFRVGSIHQLDFPDNSFDFVVGTAILHHLPKDAVVAALREAHRVLKPGGMALFTEPVENSRLFDLLQNLVPVGRPNNAQYRPSILQRARYKEYREKADHRSLSDRELTAAKGAFRSVTIKHYGFLIRLDRVCSRRGFVRCLHSMDAVLTHDSSPLRHLSREVLAIYYR